MPLDSASAARGSRQRYAVLSGSLGLGNLGDDALAAAFLAQHGDAYHGFTVLSSGGLRSVPGVSLVGPGRALPESRSVLALPRLGGRLGPIRSFSERIRTRLALEKLADGAPIDYVWLGGLLGLAPHIALRVRELKWASSFAARLVYYFGDASVASDARDPARELAAGLRDFPHFVAVRSAEAAQELESLGLPDARVGTDAVLYQYGDASQRVTERPALGLVINPCNYDLASLRPHWLGIAKLAAARGLPVKWVSFSDADDLPLCSSLHAELRADDPAASSEVVASASALESLRTARATVATRFHAHIFSVCYGIPTLSVSYGSKTRRLFDDLGLAQWRLNEKGEHDPTRGSHLLDRVLSGEFTTPEVRIAEVCGAHRRVVSAFDGSLGSD